MQTFQSKNPMTEDVVWEGAVASESEINHAVEQARNALPSWSGLSMDERANFLEKFKKLLQTKKVFFAEAISKETGKPLWEANGEVDAMSAKISISIEAQRQRCPEIKKDIPQGVSVTRHKPLGVAAVFGPYNFPGHLPNGHIVPALLAGNTIVFKPSEQTPYVGELMTELWIDSGLPQGVLNLVQGGSETGKRLSSHQGINGLFFTGSWNTGKLLAKQFASYPEKMLALEMGGNNPMIVGSISDPEAAAILIIQSAFITSGQRCTCARRLIIPNDSFGNRILTPLLALTKSLAIGPYTDSPEPFMGPVISQEAAAHLLEAQTNLINNGGKPLLEMALLKPGTPLLSPGIIDVTEVSDRPDEEYFGPLLQVVRVSRFEDAIQEANRTAFGLSSGILTDDRKEYEEFYGRSRAGVVNWNAPLTGASSAAPFGGVGKSGNFRPSAFYAADYCNYPVASIEAETIKIPEKLPPGIRRNS